MGFFVACLLPFLTDSPRLCFLVREVFSLRFTSLLGAIFGLAPKNKMFSYNQQ